jgi:hypothetical protein
LEPAVRVPKSKKIASAAIPAVYDIFACGGTKRSADTLEGARVESGSAHPTAAKRQRRDVAAIPASDDIHRYAPRTKMPSASPKRAREEEKDEECPVTRRRYTPLPKRTQSLPILTSTSTDATITKFCERTHLAAVAASNKNFSRYDKSGKREAASVDEVSLSKLVADPEALKTAIDALLVVVNAELKPVPSTVLTSENDFAKAEDRFKRYDREWKPELSDLPAEIDQKRVDALIQDQDALERELTELLNATPALSPAGSDESSDDDEPLPAPVLVRARRVPAVVEVAPFAKKDSFSRYDFIQPIDYMAIKESVRVSAAARPIDDRVEVPHVPNDLTRYDGLFSPLNLIPARINQGKVDMINNKTHLHKLAA